MNATLLAALNDAERLLVDETEPGVLAGVDEDQVLELHSRVRRARNKHAGQYRRTASAKVTEKGGRGAARGSTERASLKAQAFEEALARVSRRLATMAKAAAGALGAKRLAAARAGSAGPAVPPAAARSRSQKIWGKPDVGRDILRLPNVLSKPFKVGRERGDEAAREARD
jgi:hypothetical protein